IYAIAAGTVTHSGWLGIGGNAVKIAHGDGIESYYGHMVETPAVRYGQHVERGQVIGYVGMTGLATGPHVHFGILSYGGWIEAESFMASRGAPL
ncbi:MAG: M23 family metallopeptidase, partial [Microbacteriaceae bacterium]|nr:M23 family metallopeptidase [Microbacteriaceae bacterium]